MLFSLDWLLSLCPVERDVERIVAALTDRGLTVDSVDAGGADTVLDVDVPANRPDCLGHVGVARELSAAFGATPAPVDAPPTPDGAPTEQEVRVEIAAPALCPRYTAGVVREVRVGPSPEWVVARLAACGLRSVNNVVDASNLVMLELGQPIHFFDLDLLESASDGKRLIRVRTAEKSEVLRTLDDVERKLGPEMLLIGGASRALAIAGVIGGAATEIGSSARNVLIEAAHFDPVCVRRTARGLGVQTDASFRFERGVDREAPLAAQSLAARLLHELAGGRPAPGVVDVYPAPLPPRQLSLHATELHRLLGFEPEPQAVIEALERVGLAPRDGDDGTVRVSVPSWRGDIEREADLVEEVARHLGYDRIPASIEVEHAPEISAEAATLEDRAREVLGHLGFHEAIGYAMLAVGEDERFVDPGTPAPLSLVNPIAEPLARLRRSVLPGLLRALDLNLRRGSRDVRLFEVGSVFIGGAGGTAPDEPTRIGVAWSGRGEPGHWSRDARPVDLYDVMGLTEHLLRALRRGGPWSRGPAELAALHPARGIRWSAPDGSIVAWGGVLHPALQRELDHEVFLLEVALDRLALVPTDVARHRQVPRVPSVTRDLSLRLTRDVAYSVVIETLAAVEAPAPTRFAALDRYEGPPLAEGECSITIRVTLEPLERTLTDDEIERYRLALVEKLRSALDLEIRS